ncbi:MAG: hypothetical protein ACJAXX_001303 [Roseivirga sp.]|jgi:hypothetical protein
MESLKKWETPVLLELSQAASENNTFVGRDDGDSGSKKAS